MERNKDLFYAIAERIEKDRSCWDQRHWASKSTIPICGTVGCFAGHAVDLSFPGQIVFERTGEVFFPALQSHYTISEVARNLLGLTKEESFVVFSWCFAPKNPAVAMRLLGNGVPLVDILESLGFRDNDWALEHAARLKCYARQPL